MKRINLNIVIVQLIATTFIIVGFENLTILFNSDLYLYYSLFGKDGLAYLADANNTSTGKTLSNFILSSSFIPTIGLLTGTLIFVIQNKRKKISWVNSLLIFIIGYLLFRFDITEIFTKASFLVPVHSKLFIVNIISITGILISIGLGIFFSKKLIKGKKN